ncbi:hypothetical protein PMAYCL1PPCAC_01992 [Pristionchus mayeri]|uniref:GATA-type domain-containing protein n=1 Tax=Pristionchus mayeri TaxID=1317129 RepID=A0AAN4Z5P4_9BILA|nr:hypothetical protein PMAYCL1PPCAC_01992 [Pristionchus mayeri]
MKSCYNCNASESSVWRRTQNGELRCNACWLYFRDRGVERPKELWRDKIIKRKPLVRRKQATDVLNAPKCQTGFKRIDEAAAEIEIITLD